MADYVPIVLNDDETTTYTANGTGTGGDVVLLTGAATAASPNGLVTQATAASDSVVGVAAYDYVAGQQLTVYSGGVQELVSAGAITAGAAVVAAASGRIAAYGGTNPQQIIGVALSTTSGAAQTCRVRWTR